MHNSFVDITTFKSAKSSLLSAILSSIIWIWLSFLAATKSKRRRLLGFGMFFFVLWADCTTIICTYIKQYCYYLYKLTNHRFSFIPSWNNRSNRFMYYHLLVHAFETKRSKTINNSFYLLIFNFRTKNNSKNNQQKLALRTLVICIMWI